ncbi:MAG: hypothetical protein PHU26_05540 [Methanofollis liminatans]|nr:hypothetical protein [Methanofollis liminatans]
MGVMVDLPPQGGDLVDQHQVRPPILGDVLAGDVPGSVADAHRPEEDRLLRIFPAPDRKGPRPRLAPGGLFEVGLPGGNRLPVVGFVGKRLFEPLRSGLGRPFEEVVRERGLE